MTDKDKAILARKLLKKKGRRKYEYAVLSDTAERVIATIIFTIFVSIIIFYVL
jgi:hypothetical protein